MALPNLQNETGAIVAYESVQMEKELSNIDSSLISVFDVLSDMMRVNERIAAAVEGLFDIEGERWAEENLGEGLRLEAQREDGAQTPFAAPEKDKEDPFKFLKDNALNLGLAFVAAAGLIYGFQDEIKNFFSPKGAEEYDKDIKKLEEKAATEGLTESEAEELDIAKIAKNQIESGVDPGNAQINAMQEVQGRFDEFEGTGFDRSPEEQAEFDKAKAKRRAIGKITEAFEDIEDSQKMVDSGKGATRTWYLWETHQELVTRKIKEIHELADKYDLKLPTNIAKYLNVDPDKYVGGDIVASPEVEKALDAVNKGEPPPDVKPEGGATEPDVIKPEMIPLPAAAQVNPDALNLDVAASGTIDRGTSSVQPSGNESVTKGVTEASKQNAAAGNVTNIKQGDTINNVSNIYSGRNGASAVSGVPGATRSNQSPAGMSEIIDPVSGRFP